MTENCQAKHDHVHVRILSDHKRNAEGLHLAVRDRPPHPADPHLTCMRLLSAHDSDIPARSPCPSQARLRRFPSSRLHPGHLR